jgi:hypothetical protein
MKSCPASAGAISVAVAVVMMQSILYPEATRPGAASIEQVGVPGQVRQDHVHKITLSGRWPPLLNFFHSHLC